MFTVDGRCPLPDCGPDSYWMVGRCANCGVDDVLMRFTKRHSTRLLPCPACCCPEVKACRRADVGEIPAVLSGV